MQSIGSIMIDLRKVKGCLGIDLQESASGKDQFTLRLDWQNLELIIELLLRKEYDFLEGAIIVLCEAPTIEIINGNKTVITGVENNRKTSIKEQILSELKHKLSDLK